MTARLTTCPKTSPQTWTGHWRDWHRGHGCDLDPNLDSIERSHVAPGRDTSKVPRIVEIEPAWSPYP